MADSIPAPAALVRLSVLRPRSLQCGAQAGDQNRVPLLCVIRCAIVPPLAVRLVEKAGEHRGRRCGHTPPSTVVASDLQFIPCAADELVHRVLEEDGPLVLSRVPAVPLAKQTRRIASNTDDVLTLASLDAEEQRQLN